MGISSFFGNVLHVRPRPDPPVPPPSHHANSPPRRRRNLQTRQRHDRPSRLRDRSFERIRPRTHHRSSLDNTRAPVSTPPSKFEEDDYALPPADFEDEFASRSTAHLSRRSNKLRRYPAPDAQWSDPLKPYSITTTTTTTTVTASPNDDTHSTSRRRIGWRNRRSQSRAASNLESTFHTFHQRTHKAAVSTATVNKPQADQNSPAKQIPPTDMFEPDFKIPPSPRRATPFDDPAHEQSSSSFKRFFSSNRTPDPIPPSDKLPPRRHGRIRSSLEYFIRRESADSAVPRSFNSRRKSSLPPKPHPVPPPTQPSPLTTKLPDTVQPLAQFPKRTFADPEAVAPPMRFSTDASFPNRPVPSLTTPFTRSQSNPAASSNRSFTAKRAHRNRPPPLITPVGGATGFACGVGADSSGMKIVPLGRESIEREKQYGVNISAVTLDSDLTDREPSPIGQERNETPAAPLQPWDPQLDRDSKANPATRSSVASQKDDEVFFFEEASQSSFGDTETPSRVAAKNGIIPMERQQELASVTEDHFVFGTDGSYNDCGFIISSHGMVEAPESVLRKNSDGLAVEGVPTSSNHLIFVRSLDEFRKGFTFKDNSSEGSSTLGRGAAGRVSLAVHKPTGRKIAVKEINVYDKDKRNQLTKELETLISHQSRFLVRSFGAFYDGAGVVSVTLEYMDRGSLADIIQQSGPVPHAVICKIAEHCLRGLCFLHDNHILHRDIKTGNILLSRKLCRAKLSDFGLARNLEQGSSWTDTFVGTLGYMSPERLHGSGYTYASDIWSLGISILECVMGRFPFDKPAVYFDVVSASTSNPSSLVEDVVSSELLDFIRLCTDVDPAKRPQAREMLEHEWIRSSKDDANALREWLDNIPPLHAEDAEIGSELAFALKAEKQATTMAKIRAKAVESSL